MDTASTSPSQRRLFFYVAPNASEREQQAAQFIASLLRRDKEAAWTEALGQMAELDSYEGAAICKVLGYNLRPEALPALECDSYHSTLLGPWSLEVIDSACYEELCERIAMRGRLESKHGEEAALQFEQACLVQGQPFVGKDDALVCFSTEGASLSLSTSGKMKPLLLDFEQVAYRQRLLRGGRLKEAVARACMQGLGERVRIFDATAGLGRESMILAHAGAQVFSFERQIPIWVILADALLRAQTSRFFPFTLPHLLPVGTIKDFAAFAAFATAGGAAKAATATAAETAAEAATSAMPDVIYYDPMFPERESSALVKKEMVLFKKLIGADKDTVEFLEQAVALATKRVVVKRPSSAPQMVSAHVEPSHEVDGGQCRFDCYKPLNSAL